MLIEEKRRQKQTIITLKLNLLFEFDVELKCVLRIYYVCICVHSVHSRSEIPNKVFQL